MDRNEAIKEVRSFMDQLTEGCQEAIRTLVPELAESEAERIRSLIYCLIRDKGVIQKLLQINGVSVDDALAYLEKQKDRKPAIMKPHKGDGGNPYDMGVSEAQEYAIKRGFGIPFNDGEVFVDERYITQTIGNILRWADEHPKEQKPAEWSEEDERMFEDFMHKLEVCDLLTNKEITWAKSRLKSIRPQPHWKPSEEQIKAIDDAIGTFRDKHLNSKYGSSVYIELCLLRNDLSTKLK